MLLNLNIATYFGVLLQFRKQADFSYHNIYIFSGIRKIISDPMVLPEEGKETRPCKRD